MKKKINTTKFRENIKEQIGFPVQFPFPTQSCPQLPNLKLTFISARVIL